MRTPKITGYIPAAPVSPGPAHSGDYCGGTWTLHCTALNNYILLQFTELHCTVIHCITAQCSTPTTPTRGPTSPCFQPYGVISAVHLAALTSPRSSCSSCSAPPAPPAPPVPPAPPAPPASSSLPAPEYRKYWRLRHRVPSVQLNTIAIWSHILIFLIPWQHHYFGF